LVAAIEIRGEMRMFADRVDAGKKLAQALSAYKGQDCVVVAIPRGGVVVADRVAGYLGCPLDLIITRKIGAPGNPELAVGAVAGEDKVIISQSVKAGLGISEAYLVAEISRQLAEVKRRRRIYLGEKKPLGLGGKTVILIDDGLATGSTARVAISAVRKEHPAKVILAVPVAPRDTCNSLSIEADEVICLLTPEVFYAVGQFYADFSQTTDEEVIEIMKKYR
jgi:putative phosphoribosyl transferase